MMKKIAALCLAGVMGIGMLTGCGGSDTVDTAADNSSTEEAADEEKNSGNCRYRGRYGRNSSRCRNADTVSPALESGR